MDVPENYNEYVYNLMKDVLACINKNFVPTKVFMNEAMKDCCMYWRKVNPFYEYVSYKINTNPLSFWGIEIQLFTGDEKPDYYLGFKNIQ